MIMTSTKNQVVKVSWKTRSTKTKLSGEQMDSGLLMRWSRKAEDYNMSIA